MRPVGVIGCPCSGTHYTGHVLAMCGLKVGAEGGPQEDGQVSWRLVSEGALWNMRWVLHQVRHPVRVISSLNGLPLAFWDEVTPFVELPEDSIARRAEFWMQWNELCEQRSHWTYTIRDFRRIFPRIAHRLGIPPELPNVPENFNTKAHLYERLTFEEICASLTDERRDAFLKQATRYGYTDEDLRKAWR